MDQYQHNVMTGQIPDVGFLPYSMPLDDLNYQVLAPSVLIPSSIKDEASDPSYVGALEDSGIPGDSQFYSRRSVASQSTSPPMSNSRSDLYNLQINNLPINSFDQVSPTATDQSRRESEDESQRAERRRAQNRAAQRAYRQRKDHSLKQREHEIEGLREELDKAQKLNKTLCKVVSLLRTRIKESEATTQDDSP